MNHLPAQSVSFRQLSIENGLSENTINDIVIDHTGFMWVATTDGLNRYDGNGIKIFRHDAADSNSIAGNSIRSLFVDHKGLLWIGTVDNGLDVYDPETGKVKHIPLANKTHDGLTGKGIGCVVEGDDQRMYIGTFGNGIEIFDPATGKFTHLKHNDKDSNSLPADFVRSMAKDKKGRIWIAHWGIGVSCYDPKTGKFTLHSADGKKNSLHSNNIRCVFTDDKDQLWVSTWPTGFERINLNTGECQPSLYGENSIHNSLIAMVWKFCEDPAGNIWMATAEQGLFCYDTHTLKYKQFKNNPNDAESLSDNNVLSVCADRSGLIWAGTWSAGVNILNPHSLLFGHFENLPDDTTSLAENTIWCMDRGRKTGKVWLGISAGICQFLPDENKFIRYHFNIKDPLAPPPHTIVQSLLEDNDGTLWIGSNGGGLYHYDTETKHFEKFQPSEDTTSISSQTVSALCLDKKGTLWVGTPNGGIDRFNRETRKFSLILHREKDTTTLTSNYISAICENAEGKLWVGTDGQGLNLYDPVTGKCKRFHANPADPHSLSSDMIYSLFIDKNGLLWVGTSTGLNYYDGKQFGVFTTKDGLPNDVIYSIQEDESNNLWVSTNKGIARFNPFAHLLKVYDKSDGLQSNEFNQNAALKLKDGRLLFGGVKGFNCFKPSEIVENKTVPPVVITRFTALNKAFALTKDVSFTQEISLSYKDYFFSIEFAALEFTNPARNRYRYKMEGFNEDWVEAGTTHSATFTNLDPGEYTFRVIASNNDGTWNEKGTSLHIIINPPFWKTKWFYALCILFILLNIYLFIRTREMKLLKEKALLEEKVEERTHQLKEEKIKVELAHQDIKDSINYAKRIQDAILPLSEEIERNLPDSFVFFQPRDIVSGDFYWFTHTDNGALILAAADCTGHGVPGAFMSMIGNTLLNDIIRQKGTRLPAEVLNELHSGVREALQQDRQQAESRDGMDIALCSLRMNKQGCELDYAGANRPLLIVSGGELKEIKANKFPIGGLQLDEERRFTNHRMDLRQGDIIYIFSDGYPDQFGGEKGKKFMLRHFQNLLLSIRDKPMKEQKAILKETLDHWKGDLDQVDDILVIGVRI